MPKPSTKYTIHQ